MHWPTPLLLFALATSMCARNQIAYIEFFGYQGIDVDAVRKALPFREGDKFSKTIREQARAAVKRVTGRDATDVAEVCCTNHGDYAVFIGLPGQSSRAFELNPAPNGDIAPPPELATLYRKMNQTEDAAFKKGSHEEDESPGYRLSKGPRARAAELALREYALHHEDEIINVLESSGDAARRSMAADALGYGARTPRQMAALERAARDPDSGVRNDSTRALGEILRGDPSVASRIPPDTFIDMIRSGIWTDRNKSSSVLWPLSESRDPQLLARLKSEAGDALLGMARWRAEGWAFSARIVLGRIAGIPEERVLQLATGPLDAFFSAIGR